MSISSEITRLQNAKADLKSVLEDNGVIVPANATLDDYPQLVNTASGGIFKLIATKVFNDVPELIDGEDDADTLDTGITPKDYAYGMVVVTCDSPITTKNEWGMTITLFGRYTSNSGIMYTTSVQQKGSATFSFSGMVDNTLVGNSYGVIMPNNIGTVQLRRGTHGTGCPKIRGGNYTVAVYGLVAGNPSGTPKGLSVDDIALHNIRGDIVLGDDVGVIANSAFAYYPDITSIVGNGVNTVDANGLSYMTKLTSASFPNATRFNDNAFKGDNRLNEALFPKVTHIGGQCFGSCNYLKRINLPLVSSVGGSPFYNCNDLNKIELPSLSGQAAGEFSRGCSTLVYADLGKGTAITTNGITSRVIEALVLRRTSAITALSVAGGIQANLVANRNLGHVYVPQDLLSTYQTATNWSTHYAKNPNLFRVLEDYTVDGTTTGAFDFSKIDVTHTPVYSAQDLEFDGTNYVDTGVALFDANIGGNFTIFLDYTTQSAKANSAMILSCATAGNKSGFWLRNNGGSATSTICYFHNGTNEYSNLVNPTCSTVGDRVKIIIRAINGDEWEIFVYTTSGRYKQTIAKSIPNAIGELSETLLLGASINSSGNIASYSKGTMHDIQVYDTVLSNWEIAKYMGWTDYILEDET